jgi:hypothetical protein
MFFQIARSDTHHHTARGASLGISTHSLKWQFPPKRRPRSFGIDMCSEIRAEPVEEKAVAVAPLLKG